ncbi:WD40-repeat-containing domain protein, partial [Baffinella frigidus]
HSAGIRTMAFSPCGQRLATAGDDCAVILWEAQTGKLEHRMQGHTQTVTSLAYSPDGARLASGGVDRSIRVWDPTTGALLRSIPEKCEELGIAVHFSPTEPRRLASVASDMLLAGRQWDVDSGEMIKCVEDYEFSFLGRDFVEFSPDGSTIATASTTRAGDIHLLDAESGTLRLKIVGHHDYVISVAWCGDGSKLASISFDCTCKVWDASTGARLRTIKFGGETVASLAWGRD